LILPAWTDLYGGFEPNGWTRDIWAHSTVLDGRDSNPVLKVKGPGRVDGLVVRRGCGLPGPPHHSDQAGIGVLASDVEISNSFILDNRGMFGGGMRVAGERVEVRNNAVARNFAGDYGGGMFIVGSGEGVDIHHNLIRFNLGGGGVYHRGEGGILADSIVSGNLAGAEGGGILCSGDSDLTLVNSVVSGNRAACGGALCASDATPLLVNSTLADNSAKEGGALWLDADSHARLVNTLVANNTRRGIYVADAHRDRHPDADTDADRNLYPDKYFRADPDGQLPPHRHPNADG